MCFINYTEMARVTGVPFNYLLSRGQSIKVLSQLFRKANDDGYVVPALKGEGESRMQILLCSLAELMPKEPTSNTKVPLSLSPVKGTTMYLSQHWTLAHCTLPS